MKSLETPGDPGAQSHADPGVEPELQQEASRDYLTGLLNRRDFRPPWIPWCKEDALALYLFDLDNLKSINDTFGHAEGTAISGSLPSFALPHPGIRYPVALRRDEFVVVMKQMKTDEAALKRARRLPGDPGNGGRRKFMVCTAGGCPPE